MRVVILRNPGSGRGKGRIAVDELVQALAAGRHRAVVFDVHRSGARDEQLAAALGDSDAFIIAGGDGTVHHAAPLAMEFQVPIIHYPTGTENLFAREFGLVCSPAEVLRSLGQPNVRRVDVGCFGDRPFTLMASLGFDACIVQRVAAARRGAISRSTYLRHGAAELLHPRFVPLTVMVDGRRLVNHEPGMVVVANSRQYAARLDPAREASMTDGSLDVVFIPLASRVQIIRRGVQVLTGAHLRDASIPRLRGSHVTVIPAADLPLQLDGEFAGVRPALAPLEFSVHPGALQVIAP